MLAAGTHPGRSPGSQPGFDWYGRQALWLAVPNEGDREQGIGCNPSLPGPPVDRRPSATRGDAPEIPSVSGRHLSVCLLRSIGWQVIEASVKRSAAW